MLGYDRIRVATTDSRFEIEEAASDTCRAINMEVWHTEPHVDQDLLVSKDNAKPGKAIFGYSSVIGLESLFVPKYLPFSSTHYQALHDNVPENRNGNLSRPMDVFPPDGTIGLEQLDSLFPDGDPWGCFTDAFSEGGFECNTGRW